MKIGTYEHGGYVPLALIMSSEMNPIILVMRKERKRTQCPRSHQGSCFQSVGRSSPSFGHEGAP